MKKIEPRASRSAAGPTGAQRRDPLLYVEDNDDNWRVTYFRLGESYDLVRARDAREACRVLKTSGPQLAAVLMDIELRGSDLNGIELTQLIRGRLPPFATPDFAMGIASLSTPVIFVTAHGAKYSEEYLLAIGGNKVISKPVDFAALSLALTQLHLSRVARQAGRRPRS